MSIREGNSTKYISLNKIGLFVEERIFWCSIKFIFNKTIRKYKDK
ncbi:hypothetical protein [Clostridioides difficile]|nr:hypothetical protein [Clostridioides difficile]